MVRITDIDLYLCREACNQYTLIHKSERNFLEIIYFINTQEIPRVSEITELSRI
jgi:hypothetical protein